MSDISMLRYKRLKEKLLLKLDAQEQKLEYIFENEGYISKLKFFELEGDTIELFYNLYFNPFNLDSWLQKSINLLVKQNIENILESFCKREITSINDAHSLGYLRNLRDFVMYKLKNNETVIFRSQYLTQTYVCIINIKTIQLFNKYHKENTITVGKEIFEIQPLNKHLLLQFVLNPFWNNNGYITTNYTDENKIVNTNWEVIDSRFSFDCRVLNIQDQVIEKYFNVLLEEDLIDLNKIEKDVYYLLKIEKVDYFLKEFFFETYQKVKEKVLNHEEIRVVQDEVEDPEDKTVVWECAEPLFDIENLLLGKRNLFSKLERQQILDSELSSLSLSDLGIVLPLLFDGKNNLMNIIHYFFQNKPYFQQNSTRKAVMASQFPEIKGSKYISNYGIEFILKAQNKNINLKTQIIWDSRLWKFNQNIMHLTCYDIFDFIDNQSYHNLMALLNSKVSVESQISTLMLCRKTQQFCSFVPYFYESNLNYLFEEDGLRLNLYKIKKEKVDITKYSVCIEPSMVYANYLIDNMQIDNIIGLKSLNYGGNLDFMYELNVSNQIKILTKDLREKITIEEFKYFEAENNVILEFSLIDNSWNMIMINGKLPLFHDIKIVYDLENNSYFFDKKVFYKPLLSENNVCQIIIKKEYYNLFYSNLIVTKN